MQPNNKRSIPFVDPGKLHDDALAGLLMLPSTKSLPNHSFHWFAFSFSAFWATAHHHHRRCLQEGPTEQDVGDAGAVGILPVMGDELHSFETCA